MATSKSTNGRLRGSRPVKAEKKSEPGAGFLSTIQNVFKFSREKPGPAIEPSDTRVTVKANPK